MPIELNEEDIQTVMRIQEAKNTTIARAKEYYRLQVKRLANPDVADRAKIILENFQRGKQKLSDVFEEQPTKAKKQKAEKPAKAAKPPKAEKAPKAARVEVPLPEIEKEVELKPVADHAHVFTANLFGKKHAVIQAEIDHGKGVKDRFGYVGVSERRLTEARQYAQENDLPVAICATVRVKGRLDQGYAVPVELFERFVMKSKHALTLGSDARAAYGKEGWAGVKFTETK